MTRALLTFTLAVITTGLTFLALVVAVAIILLLATCAAEPAFAAEGWEGGFKSSRPEGWRGVGHAEHHQHYRPLHNKIGTHCCDDGDCRPTTARWTGSGWDVMVNGHWMHLKADSHRVLDSEFLEKRGTPRWDTQAHVCVSPPEEKKAEPYILCFIEPEDTF